MEIDHFKRDMVKIDNEKLIEKQNLEKFINRLKKQDDETFALMKYTRQDNHRIKVNETQKNKSLSFVREQIRWMFFKGIDE